MQRDMTEKQFKAALIRHGMRIEEYSTLGYVDVGNGLRVSMLNANSKRFRAILAYLLAQQEKEMERSERHGREFKRAV